VIAVAAGLLFLAPSLTLLLRLTLAGRFDPGEAAGTQFRVRDRGQRAGPRIVVAGSLLLVGCSLTVLSDATWGLALGVASLLGFLVTAFAPLADPPEPDDASAPVDAVLERNA
jgi:hypothetical protein